MSTPDLTVQRVRHPIKARLLQVQRVTQLTPAMLRITLTGDDLEGFHSGSFDDHLKLLVPPGPGQRPVIPTPGPDGLVYPEGVERPQMRDYTPRQFNAEKRELDIDFVLHHSGPATDWAANAKPGDYIGIAGPRGSFIIPHGFDWHVMLGDETAIPAIGRRLAELPEGAKVFVVVETRTPEAKMNFQTRSDASVQWVLQDADAKEGMSALEAAARRITLPEGEGFVWAGAEYSVIRRLQQYYSGEVGLHKDRIRASSYWRAE